MTGAMETLPELSKAKTPLSVTPPVAAAAEVLPVPFWLEGRSVKIAPVAVWTEGVVPAGVGAAAL